MSATSTDHAPWYVVPADDKENARLIVSQIVLETFKDLKMEYPKATKEHLKELKAIRKELRWLIPHIMHVPNHRLNQFLAHIFH